MEHALLRLFPNVSFGHNVQVLGMANVHIGPGSCVGDNSWLNVCFRDDKIRLRIGTRVLVGRGSMLSAGGLLEVGDYCLLAPQVFISDADHVYRNIMRPYMDQGATAGKVVVEENCWLGIHAVVSGNIIVGRGSVVAANAVVTKDVPPFAVVAGVPARVLKLFNFNSATWDTVQDEVHYHELLTFRKLHPPPPRDVYAKILQKNSSATAVDPINADAGQCR